jgi:hypothetical protein
MAHFQRGSEDEKSALQTNFIAPEAGLVLLERVTELKSSASTDMDRRLPQR